MAYEPAEKEKLNEYDRTEEEVAECHLAEELADKIQAALKDQPHNAAMDALGMVLRSMADEYYGPTWASDSAAKFSKPSRPTTTPLWA